MSKKLFFLMDMGRCKRCKEYFFPSSSRQIYCPYCQGLSTLPAYKAKCRVIECNKIVGLKGARGFCYKHYSQLIVSPKKMRKAASKKVGVVVCKTLEVCQGYFQPTRKRNAGHNEKYCPNCRHIRKKI